MTLRNVDMNKVRATVGLAFVLWFVCFYLTFSTFWLKISLSASCLAVISFALQGFPKESLRMGLRDVLIGVAAAAVLYGIFWLGKGISTMLFPFAEGQVNAIYGKGDGFSRTIVFLLLFFITGPCEEIYWRGFLQRNLCEKYGDTKGWLVATAVYALVHVWSFNFMLIGAAAVAGAFWGYLYMRTGRLAPVVVSHSLWSAFIFSVMPVP